MIDILGLFELLTEGEDACRVLVGDGIGEKAECQLLQDWEDREEKEPVFFKFEAASLDWDRRSEAWEVKLRVVVFELA